MSLSMKAANMIAQRRKAAQPKQNFRNTVAYKCPKKQERITQNQIYKTFCPIDINFFLLIGKAIGN